MTYKKFFVIRERKWVTKNGSFWAKPNLTTLPLLARLVVQTFQTIESNVYLYIFLQQTILELPCEKIIKLKRYDWLPCYETYIKTRLNIIDGGTKSTDFFSKEQCKTWKFEKDLFDSEQWNLFSKIFKSMFFLSF